MGKAKKRLEKIENELFSLRGKEYNLPIGSMARAKLSRKCDMLAIEKMEILQKLGEND